MVELRLLKGPAKRHKVKLPGHVAGRLVADGMAEYVKAQPSQVETTDAEPAREQAEAAPVDKPKKKRHRRKRKAAAA